MPYVLHISEYQRVCAETEGMVALTESQLAEIVEQGFGKLAEVLVEERVNLRDLAGMSYWQLRKDLTRALLGRLIPLESIPY